MIKLLPLLLAIVLLAPVPQAPYEGLPAPVPTMKGQ